MHIGVFDSGVGGLSVFQSIKEVNPTFTYSYCCDQLHFPYGTKSENEVVEFATDTCVKFAAAAGLDLLVVACGTASTVVLPSVRSRLAIPIVGVVPAVKPAAEQSKSKKIGVLATKATASRPYLHSLIDEFAKDCRVEIVGSAKLVEYAESKIRGKKLDLDDIRRELEPFFTSSNKGLDTIVLGCTHFPLLVQEFNAVAKWPVHWLDSGLAIARRVQHLAESASEPLMRPEILGQGYTTGLPEKLWAEGIPEFVASLGLKKWSQLELPIDP
jgi:glutamate racemase